MAEPPLSFLMRLFSAAPQQHPSAAPSLSALANAPDLAALLAEQRYDALRRQYDPTSPNEGDIDFWARMGRTEAQHGMMDDYEAMERARRERFRLEPARNTHRVRPGGSY